MEVKGQKYDGRKWGTLSDQDADLTVSKMARRSSRVKIALVQVFILDESGWVPDWFSHSFSGCYHKEKSAIGTVISLTYSAQDTLREIRLWLTSWRNYSWHPSANHIPQIWAGFPSLKRTWAHIHPPASMTPSI